MVMGSARIFSKLGYRGRNFGRNVVLNLNLTSQVPGPGCHPNSVNPSGNSPRGPGFHHHERPTLIASVDLTVLVVVRRWQTCDIASAMTSKPGPLAFHLTDRDKAILEQTDDQYHWLTWNDVKTIIGTVTA